MAGKDRIGETNEKNVEQNVTDQQRQAVSQFSQNFDKVSEWAEKIGAQRPQDRDAIRKLAKETVRAAEVYSAIARSLEKNT